MNKPADCHGCPLYGDGQGFIPDTLRDGAAVYVMSHPDHRVKDEQVDKCLRDAGLTRDEVSFAMALRCKPWTTLDPPPITQTITKDALRHCWNAHGRIPDGTRLIVAQGDYAGVTLTGESVGEWRGYLRLALPWNHGPITEPWVPEPESLPVLLTVHLARLFREPSLTLPTRLDWAKIPRILARKWPRKPPTFRYEAPEEWPREFAFDTEYWHEEGTAPTSARLTRWSASWGTGDGETCVVEADRPGGRPQVRRHEEGDARPRVITQYAPADVHHLAALTGLDWRSSVWDQFLIEDTVWKHAVLWSDHPHDLNYLGSLYSSFNRWKHLGDSNPLLYSGLDAVGLLEVDRALERELASDPASQRVWENIDRPALREFVTAQYTGLRTHPQRVNEVVSLLSQQATEATLRAQAIAGWPINLGSNPQVGHRLYEVERVQERRV